MHQTTVSSRRARMRRALAFLMALALTLGLVPGLPGLEGGASAHWADPYLSQLVEWGFIRADQAGYPDRALTRADFMAITNRAYGYHELGETPFEDVAENDWFYDDVGIAYTAKYIKGTSPTTASPNSPLTRETAATILGRNMMLQESAGELLDFTDARQISNWARGTVKSSLEHYLVSGYSDGTFRPQRNVSWGEMAAMVTNLIGTPLQEPGDYSLGGTFGNVTITSPGVTLRDTVISGDLYISGGVGLGGVTLENVTVLGRIIASGTGNSEGGQDSILLRNVTADELLVDNLQGNAVSVRADGVTEIGRTTVRTTSYIEDNTPDGMGLKYISLEGESYPEGEEPEDWEPIELTLAGRIEEVVNRTPQSIVHAASGSVAKLTVDEAAEGSQVIIDRNTVVKELDLDTPTTVTGEGDIGKLVVNAPDCVVEMLPDEIEIRPGIIAEINGEEMDSVAAQESSELPQILAGYPEARDVVPTGLDAVFMTNKAGTVYWAVSAITDGSIGEEDLIKPPSYGNLAVANGSLKIAKGNEETTAKISGLTPGGSYYLSAVLVDARDKRSTVKVISFTTPDNTTPAFCTGYPKMSKVSRTESVAVVMPNKDCKLYYALLPENATAPTENELKTSSVAGALGYGVVDVKKNEEYAFQVNDVILEETTNYVLYLWLVDADGVNKGKIFPLKFTTDDETPPEVTLTQKGSAASSVTMEYQISEPGTIYWVAFPSGSVRNYPKPQPGTEYETAPLNSDYAIQQVVNGMNIGNDGKSGRVSVKGNADGGTIAGNFNITGLKAETTYDVYYVAKDNTGNDRNYSLTVKKITVSTKDSSGPVFIQSFERTAEGDPSRPRSNSDIYIDVSEDVFYEGEGGSLSLLELYQNTQSGSAESKEQAVNRLAEVLYQSIVLHKYSAQNGQEQTIYRKYLVSDTRDDWTIDYTKATVESRKEGGIRITFPSEGLQLENGGQYCFLINDLMDLSGNSIEPSSGVDFWNNAKGSAAAGHDVKPFVVDSPYVDLDTPVYGAALPMRRDAGGNPTAETTRADMSFNMRPQSTSTVAETTYYDILLWSGTSMAYDLYYRVVDASSLQPLHTGDAASGYSYPAENAYGESSYLLPKTAGSPVDENGWIYLGNSGVADPLTGGFSGRSVSWDFLKCNSSTFAQLCTLSDHLEYQFVVTLTQHRGIPESEYGTWKDPARMNVNVAAGQAANLSELAETLSFSQWETFLSRGPIRGAESIGRWKNDSGEVVDTQELSRDFVVRTLADFNSDTPIFTCNPDGSLTIGLSLTSAGVVHYAISEVQDSGKPILTTTRYIMEGTNDYVNGALSPDVEPLPNQDPNDPPQMYITTKSPRPPEKGGESVNYPTPDWMVATTLADGSRENKITAPMPEVITRKDYGGRVVDYGEFTPQLGVSNNLAVSADKVKPGKTYFAYFVITSTSSSDLKSQVYLYQFTMPAPKKPSIIPDATDGTGNVTVSIDMRTDPAAYVITTASNATNNNITILTKKLSGDPTGNYSDYPLTGDKNKLPVPYQNYTILEALTTPYSYNLAIQGDDDPNNGEYYYPSYNGDPYAYELGYTVFDMYANDIARNHIYTLIRSQRSVDPQKEQVTVNNWGPIDSNLKTDAPVPPDTRKETLFETGERLQDDDYIFLMFAINPNMKTEGNANSADNTYKIASFTATIFRKGVMAPPVVEDASGSFEKIGTGYRGSIHILFDRDVYRKGANDKVEITSGNLLDTKAGVRVFAHGTTTAVVGTSPITAFDIDFSGARVGDRISFPGSYFANEEDEEAKPELTIVVFSEYLEVTWPGAENSPWRIPLIESGGDYSLRLNGTGLTGGQSARALSLNAGTTSNAITAELDPSENLTDLRYIWSTLENDGVVELWDQNGTGKLPNGDRGGTITIRGVRPGKATVEVSGRGIDENNTDQQAQNSIAVTVAGDLDTLNDITMAPGETRTIDIKANGLSISSTASVEASSSDNAVVRCSAVSGKLTLTAQNRAANNAKADITVGLKASDGTELAKSVTFTVTIIDTTKTTNAPNANTLTLRPTLTLSANSVTLDMGSSAKKTATVTAKVTPSGSRVTWTSADEKVATVSGGRITAKAIGTTTVTAKVTTSAGTVSKTVTVKVTDSVTGLTMTASTGKQKAAWSEKDKTLTLYRGGTTTPTATFTVKTNAAIPSTAQVYCAVADANGKALKTNFITCERTGSGTIKVTVKGGVPEGTATPVKVTLGLEAKTGGTDLTAQKYTFSVKISGNDSGMSITSR